MAQRREACSAGSGARVVVIVPAAWGWCQLGRDPLPGKKRSLEQTVSWLSTVIAGRPRDPEVSEELLWLFPSPGHQARVLRDQTSSDAVN